MESYNEGLNVNCVAELRGVERKVSKNGNVYYNWRFETATGYPFQTMSRDEKLFDATKHQKGKLYRLEILKTFGQYPKFDLVALREVDK